MICSNFRFDATLNSIILEFCLGYEELKIATVDPVFCFLSREDESLSRKVGILLCYCNISCKYT